MSLRHLHRFWLWARATWVVKHDSFEPIEATLAFGFWINAWRMVDVFCPGLHKWKLHGAPQKQREFKNQVKQTRRLHSKRYKVVLAVRNKLLLAWNCELGNEIVRKHTNATL